jgi:UTP-glucose-1-phosphate uridylyltransferase
MHANNGCDQAVSNNAVAVISPDLLVTTQPSNVNECIGGTNTMTVVVVVVQEQLAINGNQAWMGQTGWVNATGTGSTTATFTPPSTVAGNNLLQGM